MKISIFKKIISISAASITGKRSENEDSVGWIVLTKNGIYGEIVDEEQIESGRSFQDELIFCIICDGMGGLDNGKAVSSLVVKRSLAWVQKRMFEEAKDIFISYRNYLHDLEVEIMSFYPESGTTVVVCFCYKNKWYSMHLGDSRCYSLSKGKVTRTRDHSPVEELFRSGIIDESEMNSHPMKNMISAFIGGNHSSKLVFEELSNPERIILCSDGLYGHMGVDDNEFVLKNAKTVEEMVDNAFNTGSNDNISVIMIESSST